MSAAKTTSPQQQQLAWRVQAWREIVDMSNPTFYRERAAGLIRTIKIGSSTRVVTSPEEYIAAKIAAQAEADDGATKRAKELVEIRRAKHSTTLRHRRLSETAKTRTPLSTQPGSVDDQGGVPGARGFTRSDAIPSIFP